jgi:hypothetical protein
MGLSSLTQTDNRAIAPGPPQAGPFFGSGLCLGTGNAGRPASTPLGGVA